MIKLVGYFLFITSFQRTLIVLSSKSLTLGQASLCTEIPYPFVMYPIIRSPGTGLQQDATLTFISSIPSTMISVLTLGKTTSLFWVFLKIISKYCLKFLLSCENGGQLLAAV